MKTTPCTIIFFFNHPASTEIYTLSLHDALPIYFYTSAAADPTGFGEGQRYAGSGTVTKPVGSDRKSTRLNSSHSQISYAVFCLKKKRKIPDRTSKNTTATRCRSASCTSSSR